MNKDLNKLAIVRTSISHLSITHYNSQELGLAMELSKQNVFIDIFYAGKKEEVVNINDYVRIIYLTTVGLYKQQGFLKNIKYYLLKEDYDLIQVSEESMIESVLISKFAKKHKIPVVLLQGMYEPHSGVLKKIFQRTYNIFLLPILRRNIELAICKTVSAQNYLLNLNFSNTKVISVGFNSDIINSKVKQDSQLKMIDTNKDIILYIGKLEHRRNPNFILELAKLYEANENLLFLCVGNGELEQDFINKKGINILHFNQLEQNQLQFLYKKAKLFLMPTNYEIFGMVYLECMHFGVPVITTLNAGSKDLFDNNDDSFVLESLDIKTWKNKIDVVLNSDLGKDFSLRLKSKSRKYNWSVISKLYLAEYQNTLRTFYQ